MFFGVRVASKTRHLWSGTSAAWRAVRKTEYSTATTIEKSSFVETSLRSGMALSWGSKISFGLPSGLGARRITANQPVVALVTGVPS